MIFNAVYIYLRDMHSILISIYLSHAYARTEKIIDRWKEKFIILYMNPN